MSQGLDGGEVSLPESARLVEVLRHAGDRARAQLEAWGPTIRTIFLEIDRQWPRVVQGAARQDPGRFVREYLHLPGSHDEMSAACSIVAQEGTWRRLRGPELDRYLRSAAWRRAQEQIAKAWVEEESRVRPRWKPAIVRARGRKRRREDAERVFAEGQTPSFVYLMQGDAEIDGGTEDLGLGRIEARESIMAIAKRARLSKRQQALLELELQGATSDDLRAEGFTPSDRQDLKRRVQRAAGGFRKA